MKTSEYKNIYINENYHFFYKSTHENILNLIRKYSKKSNGLKILDAGCGTGLLMKKLSYFGEVWGVDMSEKAIFYTKKRGIKNVKKASVTKLPFKNNLFDLVVSIDVLYHQNVEDDLKALSQFRRVVKPGGIVIIKVPAHNWLQGRHDKIVHTKHRYSLLELNNKLKKVGFKIKYISWGHLVFLLMALIKRFVERFFNSADESDVIKLPSVINTIFIILCKIENYIMINLSLPNGLSVYAVAVKPQHKGKNKKNS